MTPLHHQLTHDFASASDIGFNYGALNYSPMSGQMGGADLNFHMGSAALGGGGGSGPSSLLSGGEQWRLQQPPQFPFLPAGFDPSSGLFESGAGDGLGFHVRPKLSSSGITHQMASVKMEDNPEINLSRQLLGIPASDQYWSGGGNSSANNAWTHDASGFSSSSTTTNPL